jgi:hypothetical protein
VDATDDQKKAFVNLIQCYSVGSEDVLCFFHLDNLESYFSGHSYGSYLSFYNETYYTKGNGADNEIIRGDKPIGCISSRSGTLVARGHKESIYYIDFMTIDRNMASVEKIYREMFETHIYKIGFVGWKSQGESAAIRVWVFRRIGVILDGIVPCLRFQCREYEIPNNPSFFIGKYPEHVVLVDIHGGNLSKMTDTLDMIRDRFSVYGITDEANLVGLIQSGILYVYALERLGDVLALYFFRDTRCQLDGGAKGSILELVAAVYIGGSVDLFHEGFLGAVGAIVKKNYIYRRLRVDGIADAGLIDWRQWYLVAEVPGAYYTYNLVVPGNHSLRQVCMIF